MSDKANYFQVGVEDDLIRIFLAMQVDLCRLSRHEEYLALQRCLGY